MCSRQRRGIKEMDLDLLVRFAMIISAWWHQRSSKLNKSQISTGKLGMRPTPVGAELRIRPNVSAAVVFFFLRKEDKNA